jgi:hypothetical protein
MIWLSSAFVENAVEPIPVSSSLIARAAYDAEAGELHLWFKSNGAHWIYGSKVQPFTQSDADAFAGASSAGQHFLQNVKGSFPERRG